MSVKDVMAGWRPDTAQDKLLLEIASGQEEVIAQLKRIATGLERVLEEDLD